MSIAGCPNPQQLQSLLHGGLSSEDESQISQHLDDCAACQQNLERLAGQTDLLHDVQERLRDPDETGAPDMATVISRFQSDIEDHGDRTEIEQAGFGEEFSTVDESQFMPAQQHRTDVEATGIGDEFSTQADAEEGDSAERESSALARIDDIEIVKEIGRGGMGVVFKGLEKSLDRHVAVKMLARRLAKYSEARERFTREAQSLAAVRHRYIVSIFRIIDPVPGESGGHPPCLVMEFVEGLSLEKRIRRKGPLPIREVVRTGAQIAAGLAAAHEQGIIHRDIKPANILLERSSRDVKITDFGLARAADDIGLTQTGTLVGTPAYMSPEQAEGARIDRRSDLFSLGSVLYAMLAGRPPFAGTSTMKTMGRILQGRVEPVEEVRKETPEWLAEIIRRLHARNPADRFQSAEEVVWLLQEGRAELIAQARGQTMSTKAAPTESAITAPAEPTQQSPRSTRRQRFPLIAASVSLAAVLFIAAGLELTGVTDFFNSNNGETPSGNATLGDKPRVVANDDPPVRDTPGPEVVNEPHRDIVVLIDGERDSREFESLGEAVAVAPDGSMIELHTNGPIFTPTLRVRGSLTIRAASGYRPQIVKGKPIENDGIALVESTGQLRLEGLVLFVTGRPAANAEPEVRHVVLCRGGSLHMTNCRLSTQAGDSCLNLDRAGDCRVQNCELFSTSGAGLEWTPATDAKVTLRNNLHTGFVAIAIHHQTTDVGQPELHLERCTMSTFHGVKLIVPEGASRENDSGQPVGVFTEKTVLDVRDSVLRFDVPDDQLTSVGTFRVWEIPERIRGAITWHDRLSLFGQPPQYVSWFPAPEKENWPPWAVQNYSGWARFWGMGLPADSISERVRYESGRPTRSGLPLPDDIAEQFRVTNQLPAAESEFFGIDEKIIGPGEAFDNWHSTPAWQNWRESGSGNR